MTNIKQIRFLLTSFAFTLLLTACGSALDSTLMGGMGLMPSGLSAGAESDFDAADDSDLIEDEYDVNVGLSQTEIQAAQALDDAGLVDEEASLIGAGSMGPESIPVTLSKGDETAPPSEDCNADSQGAIYVITDNLAFRNASSPRAMAVWFSSIFQSARADVIYVHTTLKEFFKNAERNHIFENPATNIFQCQVELNETDSDSDIDEDINYEWVQMDSFVVQDYVMDLLEDSELLNEKSMQTVRYERTEIKKSEEVKKTKSEYVVKASINKTSDRMQPVLTIQANETTGKKEIFVNKSFEGYKTIE